MNFKILILIIGAGLTACSFGKETFVSGKSIPMTAEYPQSPSVDSIVAPYKLQLDREMNQIIATAEVDFINERPWGNLGNLVADIILEKGRAELKDKKAICLLNFGGLRAPISKGNVTLGDIFRLMPFDNQLVLVKMPAKSIFEIRDYLLKSKGEPISGFKIDQQLIFDQNGEPWSLGDFWVVTSDYLMNGGDRMTFFEERLETINTGIVFRDVIIDYVKTHQILINNRDQRIKLN